MNRFFYLLQEKKRTIENLLKRVRNPTNQRLNTFAIIARNNTVCVEKTAAVKWCTEIVNSVKSSSCMAGVYRYTVQQDMSIVQQAESLREEVVQPHQSDPGQQQQKNDEFVFRRRLQLVVAV